MAYDLAGIRSGLKNLLALRPHSELRVEMVLTAGDLALLLSPWSMTGIGPDGTPLTLDRVTSDVVQRRADGTWRFIIDNLAGSGAVSQVSPS